MQTLEKSTLTYADIHVHWPYGKIRLDKLELIQQAGAHARLSFSGWVDEEWEETMILKAGSHDRVGFIQIDESGRELPLFKGQLHEIKVEANRGIVYVMAVVISHTYELDTVQRTKSYQNEKMRYLDIVNRVMKGYPEGDYIDFAFEETKTGAFIMQYQETDWSFLKRLASHLGAELVPDVTAHKPRFWIGYPEGRGAFELRAIPFEKSRNIERYLHTEAHGQHAVTEEKYTTYTFDLGQELQLGDEVSSDGHVYNIISRQAMLERSLLQWKYTCALPASHPLPRQLQTMITGAAIEGKIIDVKRNQVKVHLDMDEGQQAGEARWFPYAAEGSQVWYMMPEPGAKVKLYFPSAEEDEAMVMQSVRQEPTEAGHVEKSGKVMQDPGVKSFGNPQGKSFTLGDSELVMNAQEGALYISMAASKGVTLNSTTHVQIQSMGDLNISGASVSLEGAEGLYIQTMADQVELVEEVNGKSENILLEAEIHRSFDMIQSAFDQSLASMGENALKKARLKRNWDAREKGQLDGVIEEGKSLLSMVGDVADLAFTGVIGDGAATDLYSWVKGEQVGSLTERNATVQGTIQGVNNAIDYTGDLVTGKKSGEEIWQDVSGLGDDYVKPFKDLKGEDYLTMLTMTEEESYEAGLNDVAATMRIVDTATSVVGGVSFAKNGVKMVRGGGNKSGHADGDGAKGGVLHSHGDGPDGAPGGAMKDGKLKTNAALMPPSLTKLGERISQTLDNMTSGAAARVPWRVERMQTIDGGTVPVIVKNDSYMFSKTGGNRGKGSDSNSSKGSPHTSHVDSKETRIPKQMESNPSSTSPKAGSSKPQSTWIPKDTPSESVKPKTKKREDYYDPHLNQQSKAKLNAAADEGIITPNQWTGKLECKSGDLEHLTQRELQEINKLLVDGKNVNADRIMTLRNQSSKLAEEYSDKVKESNGWELSKEYKPSYKDSAILGKELEEAGITRPPGSQAHHLVPVNQGGLRELIEKYGININSSANGVFLPQKAMPDWPGQVTHFPFENFDKKGNPMFRHGQEYINYMEENLKKIDKLPLSSQVKKERILAFLEETREGLLTGKLEILYQD